MSVLPTNLLFNINEKYIIKINTCGPGASVGAGIESLLVENLFLLTRVS